MRSYIFCLAVTFLLSGCALKTSDFLTTLNQETGKLYFVRPTSFKASGYSYSFRPDFTYFHSPNNEKNTVTVNFSLIGPAPVEQMESLTFLVVHNEVAQATQFEKFFVEKFKGKKWRSRFSTSIPYKAFMQLLDVDRNMKISLSFDDEDFTVAENKKWQQMKEIIYPTLKAEIGD